MDLPPILMTLGATVSVASSRGIRALDISDLFTGYYQTSLARNELITSVDVARVPPGTYCWYEKFTGRSADDWPTVGAAVWCRTESDVITEARVAVSAATERPMRIASAETALRNAPALSKSFSTAADAAAEEVETIDDLHGTAAYKREMVRVHVRRALEHAFYSRTNGAR
jgi:carbon-monoxide dehydrogenase medium subunit